MRWMIALLLLAGCAGPDEAGHAVGRSLYGASVSTGRALSIAGDRTGRAISGVGNGLRDAVNPPPPIDAGAPPALPPPYVPEGFSTAPPVTAEPLPPGRPAPAMGY